MMQFAGNYDSETDECSLEERMWSKKSFNEQMACIAEEIKTVLSFLKSKRKKEREDINIYQHGSTKRLCRYFELTKRDSKNIGLLEFIKAAETRVFLFLDYFDEKDTEYEKEICTFWDKFEEAYLEQKQNSEICRSFCAFVYLNNRAKKVFESDIVIEKKDSYEKNKQVYNRYGLTTAFIWEDLGGLVLDVPEGHLVVDELGCPKEATGKYERFLSYDSSIELRDKMVWEDKKRIRSGSYDVIYSNEPLYSGENQTDRLSLYEMAKICEALDNGILWLERLTEEAKPELKVQRDKVINAAIEYCKLRMEISSMSDMEQEKEADVQNECNNKLTKFIRLFRRYWLNGIKDVSEPWIENMVVALSSRQLGDVATYIAYEQAMSAR